MHQVCFLGLWNPPRVLTGKFKRYVAGTINYGLWYTAFEYYSNAGYKYSDFAGNIDYKKSTYGYDFHLGTNLISCASNKQPIDTIYLVETKYVAATSTSFQVLWKRRVLLKYLTHIENDPTHIFYQNNLAITVSKNHVFHKKIKHIGTLFHFIRELVNNDG